MSIENKISELNSKLINKLEQSSWSSVLVPYINSKENIELLNTLMLETQQGLKFTPPLKEWFTEFSKDMDKIKLVVMTVDYDNPVVTDDPEVLHLVLNKTENSKESHGFLWEKFNKDLILATSKNNCAYVFVGQATFSYAALVPNNKKFIMPEPNHKFWDDDKLVNEFAENVNKVLSGFGATKIKW